MEITHDYAVHNLEISLFIFVDHIFVSKMTDHMAWVQISIGICVFIAISRTGAQMTEALN
jgi:hypothetical protein